MLRYLVLFASFVVFSGYAPLSLAQPTGISQSPGLKASVSAVGINQFNTNLNSGGSFGWSYASASLGLLNNVSPVTTVGVSLRYETEFWNWSNMQDYNLGGKNPWGTIQSPGVSFIYSHKFDSDWKLNLIPTIESNAEQGAELGNSLTYGTIVNASKQLSPTLNLGLGTGVFRQIDTNRIFPFIVIDWKITDRWNLNNPFPGGPAGGAGLELSYAVTPQFKISGGAAYRSYRFRLSNSSAYAGGVGQNKFVPIFARFSYAFDRTTLLDLYTIANVGGSVSAIDPNGNTVLSTNYKTAPAIALSLVKRF
ncbi:MULTISPECIES: DUF6268 family outer membrane beta-barrel protein [unclassified Polynucleobacter]|uniref:DUF6268 family outer membrane beta-barrel protein n=1 Tax=unclassified Polynucleobacter TaxID=2640945 RepID=UPI002573A608|nr:MULTISPECIES: DUF6268 family outer membrane beta-barrel protein [unclassified Polynucleobacter]BEI43391.1 hypothetical protein PHIN10_15400 [Polynucleobacter sp. HIN10]BEI45167.1 hypothetical protein PHIN11_15390 [Polynucleobacter sp. HIN11]